MPFFWKRVLIQWKFMSQHFLRSAAYRDFSEDDIYGMSDQEIHDYFCRIRWDSPTHQACPACGLWERHYARKARRQWRCKGCGRDFSVTSNTMFANHRRSLRHLLLLIFTYVTSAKGAAGLYLCRSRNWSNKAIHANLGKIRESIWRTRDRTPLTGIVHVDGGYFCGKPRKSNYRRRKRDHQLISDRIAGRRRETGTSPWRARGMTRRNWEKRQKRRVIMVLRQVEPKIGAIRTITAVAESENERDALMLIRRFVSPDAIVMTDENPAYSNVSATHQHYAVNHSECFVNADGVNENQAESFFSRQRRCEYGTTHGMRAIYLADHSAEMEWREDTRRRPLSQLIEDVLKKALTSGYSRWWRGYYQGNHRGAEILMDQESNGGKAQ
jgi:transposase-like protein